MCRINMHVWLEASLQLLPLAVCGKWLVLPPAWEPCHSPPCNFVSTNLAPTLLCIGLPYRFHLFSVWTPSFIKFSFNPAETLWFPRWNFPSVNGIRRPSLCCKMQNSDWLLLSESIGQRIGMLCGPTSTLRKLASLMQGLASSFFAWRYGHV